MKRIPYQRLVEITHEVLGEYMKEAKFSLCKIDANTPTAIASIIKNLNFEKIQCYTAQVNDNYIICMIESSTAKWKPYRGTVQVLLPNEIVTVATKKNWNLTAIADMIAKSVLIAKNERNIIRHDKKTQAWKAMQLKYEEIVLQCLELHGEMLQKELDS